ncbi:hypothetical protein [Bacillus cabrialesii]|uniref:Uncharacterized protein n=1 Tax=Bacillus cabrialesii subsp. tritici TaxID=2944916 RepID=A0ABT9DLR0_9BACI|nr:hypothetical protein [Bacillus cabrialesii]MDO8225599.1 hypothetical protein [Bacillus cabrialesii subsp. tritici]
MKTGTGRWTEEETVCAFRMNERRFMKISNTLENGQLTVLQAYPGDFYAGSIVILRRVKKSCLAFSAGLSAVCHLRTVICYRGRLFFKEKPHQRLKEMTV